MGKISRIVAVGLFAATPLLSVAAPSMGDFDRILIEENVIGTDYKYKNPERAAKVFAALEAQINASLPTEAINGIQSTSVAFAPYKSTYVHSYTVDFDKAKIPELKKQIGSPVILSKLCNEIFFAEKFLAANNHRMTFRYQQKNGQKIADVQMNNAVCIA